MKSNGYPDASVLSGPDSETPARPLRVWPLFAVMVLEFILTAFAQAVVVAWLVLVARPENQSLSDAMSRLPERLMEATVFLLLLLASGSTLIVSAFVAGRLSARNQGESVRSRLGLHWPKWSPAMYLVMMVGSIPVLLLSVGVVILIEKVIPGDESILKLYQNISTFWGILFIILIGVLPGFSEELFFRGFVQRRLLQRYRPANAIGITSVVFGLFHVTPHGIALATIIGVWLGVMAWRANSIWPSALCHAFVNSSWNVYQVGRHQWGIPDIPPLWFNVLGGHRSPDRVRDGRTFPTAFARHRSQSSCILRTGSRPRFAMRSRMALGVKSSGRGRSTGGTRGGSQ